MQLNRLILAQNVIKTICRSYVSKVQVDVKSLSSIKVKSKDFFEIENQKVNLKIFDGQTEVNAANLKSIQVDNTTDAFLFKCSEPQTLSVVLELPVESSPELELDVEAGILSRISVEGLQTKSIKIDLGAGDVLLKNLKSDLIKVETDKGSIETKSLLLGKNIELEAEKGNVTIEKSQGDYIKVKAESITVDSCYNTHNKFKASKQMKLKNLHGTSVIKSSGEKFNLSGFSGTLNAELNSKNIEIQLSELFGENEISSTNADSVKLGFSEVIIGDTTVAIDSNCPIENSVPELMICVKNEESFTVKKKNDEYKNLLSVKIEDGKSLELSKMSWIESLNLKEN